MSAARQTTLDGIIRRCLAGQLDLGDDLLGNGTRRLVKVPNSTLAPKLTEGDWATVDIGDRTPSPPGLFLIWNDREGFILRRVEVVANSEPPMLRTSLGRRGDVDVETMPAADVCIEGRVVGVWSPT